MNGLKRMTKALLTTAALAAAVVVAPTAARGQCSGEWVSANASIPGIASLGRLPIAIGWASTSWDRDGAGPLPPVWVVGGDFNTAGTANTQNLAVWDGAAWSGLGAGIGPVNPVTSNPPTSVRALASTPNGDLIVGGRFTTANGVTVSNIARFDGTNWHAMGTLAAGSTGSFPIHAMAVMPNGDVIAAGNFASAGGVPGTHRIARWNGTAWSSVGGGVTNGGTGNSPIRSLAIMPDGDIIAGGWFTEIGGVAASFIARWDAATDTWSPLGTGTNSVVSSLAVMPNGDIVAGGEFSIAGGVLGTRRIARWDGSNWNPYGSGASGLVVEVLTVMPNGDLLAAGDFNTMDGVPNTKAIAVWSPLTSTWSALDRGLRTRVYSLSMVGGTLYAAGDFGLPGIGSSPQMESVARWDGLSWSAIGSGDSGHILDLVTMPNGDIVAAGQFYKIEGVAANNIARWNGSTWSQLGVGIEDDTSLPQTPQRVNAQVRELVVMPNGDLIAGGDFYEAGGVEARMIARWDGTQWSPLGGGINVIGTGFTPFIRDMVALPNGDLVVAGAFDAASDVPGTSHIARWDGTTWHSMGGGMDNYVYALAVLPNGDVIAGGYFNTAGGVPAAKLARWDGTSWSEFGGGANNVVNDLLVLPNGDVVATGGFNTLGGTSGFNAIGRWNGLAWSTLGTGAGGEKLALYNGDIIVAGGFTQAGGVPADSIARWNGSTWAPLGLGTKETIWCVLPKSDGMLWIGGTFEFAGGVISPMIARWGDCVGVCCGAGGSCTIVSGADKCASGTFKPEVRACLPTPVSFAMPTGGSVPTVNDSAGNNSGVADPGETVQVTVPILNTRRGFGCDFVSGSPTATGVTVTLTSLTPTATVVSGSSAYPNMADQEIASNTTPFVVALSASHPCGTPIVFQLTVNAAAGPYATPLSFNLATGQAHPSCATYAAASPVLVVDTSGNGNGNGTAEPGESTVALTLPITKTAGDGASIGATGTLTSLTPTVTVVSGTSAYPDFTTGSTHSNSTPFVIAVSPSHACGAPILLRVSLSTDGGLGSATLNYSILGGSPQVTLPVQRRFIDEYFTDNDPTGVNIQFTVSGVGALSNVKFRIDGVSTSSNAANSNTGLGHANVGDLVLKLTSPQGTTVTLLNRPGGGGSPGAVPSTANNFYLVTFDDSATNSIQNIGDTPQPVTGSFKPASPLSVFNGQNGNGVWTINIADVVPVATPGIGVTGGEGGYFRNATLTVSSEELCVPPGTSNQSCCRGTTCNTVASGTCTGQVSGSNSLVVGSCGAGNATATCCFADFNHDGSPSIDDLFLYLNAYFTSSPWANVGGDGVAAPTIDDLFLYINAYFTGCA